MNPGITFALLVLSTAAQADNGLGRLHGFKDWVVGCDNTLQCEAQGYPAEAEGASEGGPAALVISRKAGPGRAPTLTVLYGQMDNEDKPPAPGQVVTLEAGPLRFRMRSPEVPPEHVAALLAWVLKGDHVRLKAGNKTWSMSLAGAVAALLKMDELQGRLGTPGALVRKGTRPEAEVPVAPVPRVKAAAVPATTDADRRLAPQLRAALPRSEADCPGFDPAQDAVSVVRLTTTTLLVSQSCFNGAYQVGSRLWQMDDRPPFRARAVKLPAPDGESSDTLVIGNMASSGGALSLQESAKGRGIGDCWVSREWEWDGKGLALRSASQSACKLFEAGGLPITLWRSE